MKIQNNVLEFKKLVVEKIATFEATKFNGNIVDMMERYNIESPIEQILYLALNAAAQIMFMGDLGEIDTRTIDGKKYIRGLTILPQFVIGKYRVDFMISYYQVIQMKQEEKTVLIECDSQQFHDRTESERRYEKIKDREIQKQGYKIFRFTGSEIVKNPFHIAAEILSYLADISKDDIIDSVESE